MNLNVKKLNDLAKLPVYAIDGDVGMDLFSVENIVIDPGERKLIKTGISIELPRFNEAQIRSKSGLALNHGIIVLNSPGTIEPTYRGEVGVILYNTDKNNSFEVKIGMKIAQMIVKSFCPVTINEVNELSETERGAGGFGSTGT